MYYKSTNKQSIFLLASLYDCQFMAIAHAKGDTIARHWAKPFQDIDGAWCLQKPHTLECGTISECVGEEVAVVDSVTLPEPDPDDTPPE